MELVAMVKGPRQAVTFAARVDEGGEFRAGRRLAIGQV
jgi:hypothetical protein